MIPFTALWILRISGNIEISGSKLPGGSNLALERS